MAEAETESGLGPKRDAAILALLTSRGIEEAARTADVPPRTLYRWLRDTEFDAAYREAKRAAFGQAGFSGAASLSSAWISTGTATGSPGPSWRGSSRAFPSRVW